MDQYLSTAELMKHLSISRSTVNRLVARGLPHIWVGSVRRFSVKQIAEWFGERHTTG